MASFPTSYIATTTAAVTRAAEIATFPASVLDVPAGTVMMGWRPIGLAAAASVMVEGTPTANQGMQIAASPAGANDKLTFVRRDGSDADLRTTRGSVTLDVFSVGVKTKFALTWDTSLTNLGPLLSIDGAADAFDAHVTGSQLDFGTTIGLGARNMSTTPSLYANGHFSQFAIFHVAKSQGFLSAVTQ